MRKKIKKPAKDLTGLLQRGIQKTMEQKYTVFLDLKQK